MLTFSWYTSGGRSFSSLARWQPHMICTRAGHTTSRRTSPLIVLPRVYDCLRPVKASLEVTYLLFQYVMQGRGVRDRAILINTGCQVRSRSGVNQEGRTLPFVLDLESPDAAHGLP